MITTLITLLMTSYLTEAAPHPLAGSSYINNLQNSAVFSQLGFQLKSIPADWIPKNISDIKSESIEIGPKDETLRNIISFHRETFSTRISLENYVRQHLRDYNQYGFEVVGLQNHKQNKMASIIVDLTQKNKKIKSRQVFFQKDNQLIIASCLDNFEKFDQSVNICNQILGSFEWK